MVRLSCLPPLQSWLLNLPRCLPGGLSFLHMPGFSPPGFSSSLVMFRWPVTFLDVGWCCVDWPPSAWSYPTVVLLSGGLLCLLVSSQLAGPAWSLLQPLIATWRPLFLWPLGRSQMLPLPVSLWLAVAGNCVFPAAGCWPWIMLCTSRSTSFLG
jgi:hypothetical protein